MTLKKALTMVMILVILAVNVLPVSATGASEEELPADVYEKVAENANFLLEADMETGLFRLTDKLGGYVRYSVPPDAAEDTLAVGQGKMQLQSQLVVYFRTDTNNLSVVNSKVSCINRKSIRVTKIDNGIRVDFIFKNEKFSIPVQYVLNDTYLEARILTQEIEETAENRITKIDLLPYFLAGTEKENGYIMVPDGSGALIHFDNKKSYAEDYYMPVYGADKALNMETKETNTETVRLPVCGIRNSENAGVLSVITGGDALAYIGAGIGGKKSNYSHVWFSFRYREEESTKVMEMDMNSSREVLALSEFTADVDFAVRFYPLNEKNGGTDYVAMATLYRSLLQEEGKLPTLTSDPVFLLDVIGSARVKKSVLGVPVERMEQLTTASQLYDIAAQLQTSGVGAFTMRYLGWGEDGMRNVRIPNKVTVEKGLGTIKNLQALNAAMTEAQLSLFLQLDPVSYMKSGHGAAANADSVKNVFNLQAFQEVEDWYNKNKSFKANLLLTPQKVLDICERYMDSFAKNKLSYISLAEIGSSLYSDFSDKVQSGRVQSMEKWAQLLAAVDEKAESLMIDGGNVYALPYADVIVEAPVTYSHYQIEDESIPFYSIVTHGSVAMVTAPINLSSRTDYALLKAVENGMGLSFICSAEDTALLKSTEHNDLLCGEFSNWEGQAVSMYNRAYPFLNYVHSSKITAHEQVTTGVYKTTYENGAYSYVNYNDSDIEVDNVKIPAMDFVTSIDATENGQITALVKTLPSVAFAIGVQPWVWVTLSMVVAALIAIVVCVRLFMKKDQKGGDV